MEKSNFYLFTLSYDGHRYCGWQIQPNVKTVQGELNKVLTQITKVPVKTIGAGRTDTGVHALGQVVKVICSLTIEPQAFMNAVNSLLPKDVRVLAVASSSEDFLPTNDAVSKAYFYLFSNNKNESPFQKNYMSNITYQLDFELMKKACALFVGEHDFSDFKCAGSDVTNYVRTITRCTLTGPYQDTLSGVFPVYYKFEIEGNGFLKQMVRLIVGCLWEVGRHRTSLEMVASSLEKPLNKRLGPVAPSVGLYKSHVNYRDSH